jgi:hypothetical protein
MEKKNSSNWEEKKCFVKELCVEIQIAYSGESFFFQFLGTNSPVQNPSTNGVQYFNFNVETESTGILEGWGGGGRKGQREESEEIGLLCATKGFT